MLGLVLNPPKLTGNLLQRYNLSFSEYAPDRIEMTGIFRQIGTFCRGPLLRRISFTRSTLNWTTENRIKMRRFSIMSKLPSINLGSNRSKNRHLDSSRNCGRPYYSYSKSFSRTTVLSPCCMWSWNVSLRWYLSKKWRKICFYKGSYHKAPELWSSSELRFNWCSWSGDLLH